MRKCFKYYYLATHFTSFIFIERILLRILHLFYNVVVPSNATCRVCNTQIDLFIYYHYMFQPFIGHHQVNNIVYQMFF
jgi:hypothetical protein